MKQFYIKRQFIIIVVLLLVFLFSFSSVVLAAEANFDNLHVTIKPEFDKEKATFMVINGELSGSSSSKTIFYTPNTIIQDSSLHFCAINPSGEHQCQAYEKTAEDNFAKFSVPLPQKSFQVEGYFKSIKNNGDNKTLDYAFKAGQDIDKLTINIAEPKNSSNYKIEPSAQSIGKDDAGLNNAIYSYDKVKKGKEYNFKISYTKKGWDIFFDRSSMGAEATSTSSQNSGLSALGILGAVVVAIALAGLALFAFSKMGQKNLGKRATPVAPKGKARFCIKCGARLKGGTKFCPNCGAKSR